MNTQNTCAAPMIGWTAADFLDSAKRIRQYEGLALADDWANQLQVAALLIAAHADLIAALRLIAKPKFKQSPSGIARAALAKVGAL